MIGQEKGLKMEDRKILYIERMILKAPSKDQDGKPIPPNVELVLSNGCVLGGLVRVQTGIIAADNPVPHVDLRVELYAENNDAESDKYRQPDLFTPGDFD